MGMSIRWITDSASGQLPGIRPGQPAVAFDDQQPLSWAGLRHQELGFARALQRAGIAKGDRVALLLRNCTDYFAQYLGIGRAGGISVRINWRLTGAEIAFILNDCAPDISIRDAEFAGSVGAIRAGVPVRRYMVRDDGNPLPGWASPLSEFAAEDAEDGGYPELSLDDPLTLMYTSGTTGRPKGAVMTHGNSLWIGSIQRMKWKLDSSMVSLTSGPLFHSGGFEVLLMPALTGHGTAVTFASSGFTLERFLEVGTKQGATNMLLYSFMIYDLLRLPDLEERIPRKLKRIVTGGDTVMPWVYEEFARRMPGVELVQSYGLTEGGAVSTCLDFDVARGHESSVGRPQAMTVVKVLGLDEVPVAPGEEGEIFVRSPGVSPGYWQMAEASAETFADGWCKTGDLDRIDSEGFLTLAWRSKDMIRSGGENVYPAEVEKVITSHEDVGGAAIIGVPDPKYFEVGAAVLVPARGRDIDVGDVREYCLARLAAYKIPKYFVVVDELPRNPTGRCAKPCSASGMPASGRARPLVERGTCDDLTRGHT